MSSTISRHYLWYSYHYQQEHPDGKDPSNNRHHHIIKDPRHPLTGFNCTLVRQKGVLPVGRSHTRSMWTGPPTSPDRIQLYLSAPKGGAPGRRSHTKLYGDRKLPYPSVGSIGQSRPKMRTRVAWYISTYDVGGPVFEQPQRVKRFVSHNHM